MKLRLVVDGERFTKYVGDREIESGRLVVSSEGEHVTFDEHIETGDDKGKVHLGIVRWVGKKIEHLQGKVGEGRPDAFPYTKDSMVGYAMMKRK